MPSNTIYALQINGATVLVLSAQDGSGKLVRFTVEKVGGSFAQQKVAQPGDIVMFVELKLPGSLPKP